MFDVDIIIQSSQSLFIAIQPLYNTGLARDEEKESYKYNARHLQDCYHYCYDASCCKLIGGSFVEMLET